MLFSVLLALLALPHTAAAQVGEGDKPTLEATTVDGDSVSLADLEGKVVLVDFWATWCKPCKVSFPFYDELVDKYGERGFVVIAVSVDESKKPVERYLAKHDFGFSVVVDSSYTLAKRFKPSTMPTAYLVGRDGTVRDVHEGFEAEHKESIDKKIIELLDQESPQEEDGAKP